jgi:hypothetical protein
MLMASYALRYDGTRNEVEPLKLSNVRLQQIMKAEWYLPMVEIIYEAHEDRIAKISAEMEINTLYHDMMKTLRQTREFSAEGIQQLQDKIDLYCDRYLVTHANRSVTNYLHSLQAGHVRQQISRFGNLFRYAKCRF